MTPDNNEIAGMIAKLTPSITVSGASVLGFALEDWVLFVTLVYTVLQIGWFVYTKYTHFTSKGDE